MIKKSKIRYLKILGILSILGISDYLAFNWVNSVYPQDLLELVLWFFVVPMIVFIFAFWLLRIIYKEKSFFVELFKKVFFLFPIGFIYGMVNEFFYHSARGFQNGILYYGTIFNFIILYIIVGQELFKFLDN